jgi:hypothetical protein
VKEAYALSKETGSSAPSTAVVAEVCRQLLSRITAAVEQEIYHLLKRAKKEEHKSALYSRFIESLNIRQYLLLLSSSGTSRNKPPQQQFVSTAEAVLLKAFALSGKCIGMSFSGMISPVKRLDTSHIIKEGKEKKKKVVDICSHIYLSLGAVTSTLSCLISTSATKLEESSAAAAAAAVSFSSSNDVIACYRSERALSRVDIHTFRAEKSNMPEAIAGEWFSLQFICYDQWDNELVYDELSAGSEHFITVSINSDNEQGLLFVISLSLYA